MNKPEFYKKKLKNGLTVLFEKRSLPIVSVASAIRYGSAYDPLEKKGIAHFLEHLMFKGTKKRTAEEIAKEIEKKGGIINANTADDVTFYWNKLPSRHIATGIDISSDLILNPKFDDVEFEKEKKVILEEIKMYKDNPMFYVHDKINEMLYKKPFGIPGQGTEKSVKMISRKDIVDIFNSFYGTNNMILAVVGNADFNYICEMAEKYFPKKECMIKDYNPIKINKQVVEKRKGIDQAHLVFGFHSPDMKDINKYAYEIALTYLAGGMSSVLFQEIREKRGLAYAIRGNMSIGKNFGHSTIYTATLKEKIRKCEEIILKEIKSLKNINKKDFEETKEQLIGLNKVVRESSDAVMSQLIFEEITENAEEYYKYEERINSVKLEEIRKISKLKTYSTFSLIPES